MSEVIHKTLEELIETLANDGQDAVVLPELAKKGEAVREREALAHMEKAIELYKQAEDEVRQARIHLSVAYFDIRVMGVLREEGTDEMILRVTGARDVLLGRDGPSLRRKAKREKERTGETDSSLRSE